MGIPCWHSNLGFESYLRFSVGGGWPCPGWLLQPGVSIDTREFRRDPAVTQQLISSKPSERAAGWSFADRVLGFVDEPGRVGRTRPTETLASS